MPIKFSLKTVVGLAKDSFKGFSEHKITKLSGSLSYVTLFSMAPLLVVIISLCGIFLGEEAVQGKIYDVLSGFMGSDTAAQLQAIVKNAAIKGKGVTAVVIGVATLLIGATAIFGEIQDSINTIWGLKPKPGKGWLIVLRNRLLSFSLIISLGFLLLVSLALTALIDGLGTHLRNLFPQLGIAVIYILNQVITFGISSFIFAVIFKVLPDAKIRWKDVWGGAVVTAVLFMLGKFGISLYISRSKIGSTYGAAGSLVILLLWTYYSSIILYLGAEFTKARAVKYGHSISPNEYAVTTKLVEVERGKKTVQEATKEPVTK